MAEQPFDLRNAIAAAMYSPARPPTEALTHWRESEPTMPGKVREVYLQYADSVIAMLPVYSKLLASSIPATEHFGS